VKRPSPYYVEAFDPTTVTEDGPEPETKIHDCESLAEASVLWRKIGGRVIERVCIEDVTPDGDPRGLLWEWEEREALA